MEESLGSKTLKGIGWSAFERFSYQGITFVIQLVLARMLTPADYGVIAMLAIFLQVAQVFIDSGFANALIKKQDCTDKDFSTVFFYNLAVAVFLYGVLFVTAAPIARFYDTPLLIPVVRVLSLTLIFNALSIVQQTQLVKRVDFKSQSIVTFSSAVVSGAVGIYCAYKGMGPWALVVQQLLNSILKLILYVIVVRWIPRFTFSGASFRYVFNFGSKLVVSSLIDVIYKNLYKLVIGKRFTDRDLGFYSKAEEFAIFPSSNIGNIISRVCFPILSRIQDDDERLSVAYRDLIRYSSWLIFPLMIGLLSVSEPFIIAFLKEQWAPAVPVLQILCLDWMFDVICVLNQNLLFVKGRTDLVLKLQIVKKSIALAILFASVPFGVIGMCWGRVLYSIIAVVINTYYTKRIIGLGFLSQMADVLPYLTASAVMGAVAFWSTGLVDGYTLKLIVGVLVGITVYVIISLLLFRNIIHGLLRFRNNGNA